MVAVEFMRWGMVVRYFGVADERDGIGRMCVRELLEAMSAKFPVLQADFLPHNFRW